MVQSRVDGWRLSVYCAAILGAGTGMIQYHKSCDPHDMIALIRQIDITEFDLGQYA